MLKQGRVSRIVIIDEKAIKKYKANQFGSYGEWLRDKSVIFIGPAAYYDEPEELDYDVVVRVNHGYKDAGRTDVLYINNLMLREQDHITDLAARIDGISWVVTKHRLLLEKAKRKHVEISAINTMYLENYFVTQAKRKLARGHSAGTTPNMGLIAIEHLLKNPIQSLSIRGVDCYETGYYENYSTLYPEMDSEVIEHMKMKTRHDQYKHKTYYRRFIIPDKRVDIDDTFRAVLGL